MRKPRISKKTYGKFQRYGRWCKCCDKYFLGYSRFGDICLECKDTNQQMRYFSRFPLSLELDKIEKKIYKRLKKLNYNVKELV